MSDVRALLKVMPESDEINLDDLTDEINDELPADAELQDSDEEPIGFGLSALKVLIILPDGEGGTDGMVETIEELDTVQSVEVESASR